MRRISNLACAAALATLSLSAQAVTLTNADFEAGTLAGWTITDTADGSTDVQDVVMFDVDQVGRATNAARFNVGQNATPLDPVPAGQGIVLSQAFDVTVAGLHTFSADVAGHGALGGNSDGGTFELLIDGTSLDSFAAGNVGVGQVVADTLTGALMLGLGAHALEIRITRVWDYTGANSRQYVDDVTAVGPTVGTPVPAPQTLALMLTALGFLGLRRRG